MSCLNCSSTKTIEAHLVPKVFTKEVIVGRAFAIVTPNDGHRMRPSQRGFSDLEILCAACDNRLGMLERNASEELRRIRKETAHALFGPCPIADFDGDRFIRFCAGLAWKYSITKPRYGRIDLGPYQSILRDIAFSDAMDIPESVDAILLRLRRCDGDQGVFAYRAPLRDCNFGVNLVRFFVGGCLVFLKLDQRLVDDMVLANCWIRGRNGIHVLVAPAEAFEEFIDGKRLIQRNDKLSRFLDKQDCLAQE
jgi:hypothetical protein